MNSSIEAIDSGMLLGKISKLRMFQWLISAKISFSDLRRTASASSSSENGEVYPLFVWMQLRYDLYAAATSSLAMSSSAVAT